MTAPFHALARAEAEGVTPSANEAILPAQFANVQSLARQACEALAGGEAVSVPVAPEEPQPGGQARDLGGTA